MIANYHTHTMRCRHARGTEREYIENALARGLKINGFSDHSPYLFEGDYVSSFRMLPDQARDYVDTLLALREEYKGKIEIPIGFEMEYYPKFFDKTIRWMEQFHLDYLILAQHMLGSEIGEPGSHQATEDENLLRRYVDLIVCGMSTGLFSCLAHPDLMKFKGSEGIYRKYMERLCQKALDFHVPLEYNLLGQHEKRQYPNPLFWQIAAEAGNEVILGCDAHDPERVAAEDELQEAKQFLDSLGIVPMETLPLRKC